MRRNYVELLGRLVSSPSMHATTSGVAITVARLAVSHIFVSRSEQREQTDCLTLVALGDAGKRLFRIKRGEQIGIRGRLRSTTWHDRNGVYQSRVQIVVLAIEDETLPTGWQKPVVEQVT